MGHRTGRAAGGGDGGGGQRGVGRGRGPLRLRLALGSLGQLPGQSRHVGQVLLGVHPAQQVGAGLVELAGQLQLVVAELLLAPEPQQGGHEAVRPLPLAAEGGGHGGQRVGHAVVVVQHQGAQPRLHPEQLAPHELPERVLVGPQQVQRGLAAEIAQVRVGSLQCQQTHERRVPVTGRHMRGRVPGSVLRVDGAAVGQQQAPHGLEAPHGRQVQPRVALAVRQGSRGAVPQQQAAQPVHRGLVHLRLQSQPRAQVHPHGLQEQRRGPGGRGRLPLQAAPGPEQAPVAVVAVQGLRGPRGGLWQGAVRLQGQLLLRRGQQGHQARHVPQLDAAAHLAEQRTQRTAGGLLLGHSQHAARPLSHGERGDEYGGRALGLVEGHGSEGRELRLGLGPQLLQVVEGDHVRRRETRPLQVHAVEGGDRVGPLVGAALRPLPQAPSGSVATHHVQGLSPLYVRAAVARWHRML
mmetsp:Transcript_13692/g.18743  ORF Transcript_13692/g.18743 Transcript_13692/m.18743 type:complete len:465 (-) Transcript_13692:1109-2503(-)